MAINKKDGDAWGAILSVTNLGPGGFVKITVSTRGQDGTPGPTAGPAERFLPNGPGTVTASGLWFSSGPSQVFTARGLLENISIVGGPAVLFDSGWKPQVYQYTAPLAADKYYFYVRWLSPWRGIPPTEKVNIRLLVANGTTVTWPIDVTVTEVIGGVPIPEGPFRTELANIPIEYSAGQAIGVVAAMTPYGTKLSQVAGSASSVYVWSEPPYGYAAIISAPLGGFKPGILYIIDMDQQTIFSLD